MAPLEIAVVGPGVIGELHADVLSQSEVFGITAVVARDTKKGERLAQRIAERTGVRPAVVPDIHAARTVAIAATICTPSSSHAELAAAAIDSGMHVMVEKPVDVTTEGAQRLLAAAAGRPDLVVSVVSQHRYDPAATLIKTALDDGRLGRTTSGIANLPWWRSDAYYGTAPWRGTWEHDGGGALMNQGVHLLDLLLWIMGPVDRVFATTRRLAHQSIEVEDVLAATLEFESGALGSLLATTAAYPQLSARLQVHGTKGSAVLDDFGLAYFHTSSEDRTGNRHDSTGGVNQTETELSRWSGSLDATMGASHLRQFEDFAACIANGGQTRCTLEDALGTLRVVEALYQSGRERRAVSLRG